MHERTSGRRQTEPAASHSLMPLRIQAIHLKLEAPTARPLPSPLFADVRSFLLASLLRCPLRLQVAEDDLLSMYSRFTYFELQAGDLVFQEGFPGSAFYVLHEGRVKTSSHQVELSTLDAGDCFGAGSPSFCCTRTASAYATSACRMWAVSFADFGAMEEQTKARLLPPLEPSMESLDFMQCLSKRRRQLLRDHCLYLCLKEGDKMLVQGAQGWLLFFIVTGQVQVSVSGRRVRTLGPGEVLGEQSALYTGPCTATVTAASEVQCLGLDKAQLPLVFSQALSSFIFKNSLRIALDGSLYLNQLDSAQKEALLPHVHVQTYAYDEIVIAEGTRFSEGVWIVLQGSLATRHHLEEASNIVGMFGCINDDVLLEPDYVGSFTSDIVANKEEVAVGFLPLKSLRETLGSGFRLPASGSTEAVIQDLPFLQGFSVRQVEALCRLAESRSLPATAVLPESVHTRCVCLLRKGKVSLRTEVTLRELSAPSHFGYASSNPTTHTCVTAVQPCELLLLAKTHFQSLFGQLSLSETKSGKQLLLNDVTIVRRYEKLKNGSIFLVADSEGREYGLKRICRKKVKSLFLSTRLRNETELMKQLAHPLAPRLISTFRDAHYVYFLKEFVPGVILSDLLPHVGHLKEPEARECVAMCIWILEYLHSLNTIHRDISSESFLVDSRGYLHLVDVGSACLAERAVSVTGSPHYIAPEVLQGQGYDSMADVWSLGVLMYELLHGRVPFGDSEEDPYLIFEAIVKAPLPPFDEKLSAECRSFLAALLTKDPQERSCLRTLKRHPWLADFPWPALTSLTLDPAFRPVAVPQSPVRPRKCFPFEPPNRSPPRNKRRLTISVSWSNDR